MTEEKQLAALVDRLKPVHSGHKLLRIGPGKDGGYLIPDDLGGIKHCFSPGVDCESDFEYDLAERGMHVYMADASVAGPARKHPNFHFEPFYVGSYSSADKWINFDTWCRSQVELESAGDLLLQMDIEGGEYEVIHNMSERLLKAFRIMVIEFHHLDRLAAESNFGWMMRALEKLLQNHAVIHIHPNNFFPTLRIRGLSIPPLMEFTFLRKDRLRPGM